MDMSALYPRMAMRKVWGCREGGGAVTRHIEVKLSRVCETEEEGLRKTSEEAEGRRRA